MESINLNSDKQERLRETIRKSFDEIVPWHEKRLFFPKREIVGRILEELKNEKDKLLKYYSKRDIWWLFFELSNSASIERIIESERLDQDIRLSDFLTQEELNDLEDDIFFNLTTVRTYHIFVNLSNVDIGPSNTINISDIYSLLRLTESVMKEYEMEKSETQEEPFKWNKNQTYLLVKQQGFFLSTRHTLSFNSMISKLKSFLGISLIQGIFEQIHPTVFPIPHKPPDPISIPIFEEIEDYLGHHSAHRFSENMSDLITRLKISDFAVKPSDDLEVIRLKGESQNKFIEYKFEKFIRPVLDSEDEDAERIKASCEWYFESLCTDNPTFRFIQFHIAIESLLGKPGIKGSITEGLAERIAFLLGRNEKGREDIRNEYRGLYNTRSDIIHRSKILSDEKLSDLEKTEERLVQLVKKEIQNYFDAR